MQSFKSSIIFFVFFIVYIILAVVAITQVPSEFILLVIAGLAPFGLILYAIYSMVCNQEIINKKLDKLDTTEHIAKIIKEMLEDEFGYEDDDEK